MTEKNEAGNEVWRAGPLVAHLHWDEGVWVVVEGESCAECPPPAPEIEPRPIITKIDHGLGVISVSANRPTSERLKLVRAPLPLAPNRK